MSEIWMKKDIEPSPAAHRRRLWGPAPVPRDEGLKTLADEAYLRIREDITQARFLPRQKLQPDMLRKRYDIGLSPVREALSRLARDGLAVAEGQRGFFVASASLDELMDVTNLRIRFSVMALEQSIAAGDDVWENGVVTSYHHLSKIERAMKADPLGFSDEWERRNRDFHIQLESGCGSPWLLHFCETLYDQIERYRRLYSVYPEHGPTIYAEHHAIMEAALSRNAAAACDVLEQHLKHARKVILERIAEVDALSAGKSRNARPKAKARPSVGTRKAKGSRVPSSSRSSASAD
jgi:GntR family transcriptional regulator, carbon starvation induced regulator